MTIEAEILRPGPVVGTGQRALALQTATLATRLSSYASVAAALFRGLARPSSDPDRHLSQRERALQFADLIRQIEDTDADSLYETSQLVPHRLWSDVQGTLELPSHLDVTLIELLDQIATNSFDRDEMAGHAETMRRLAQRLHEIGRNEIGAALDDTSEVPATTRV